MSTSESREITPGTEVYWLAENMPGTIVGPAAEGPWHWEIKFAGERTILAYTHEVIVR